MKFLVTGGLGFIGHNVVRILESLNHECLVIDNGTDYGCLNPNELSYLLVKRKERIRSECCKIDIRAPKLAQEQFAKFKPDVVIHMASFPRQKAVSASPLEASDVMCTGLVNLLENSKKYNVKRFVYISSSMVYGDFENLVTEDSHCSPIGQYGIMKLMGEHLVKDYQRQGFFDYTIIRPSAVYGEWDVEDRVVSKFVTQAMRGETLQVKGAGEVLDFTYVEDAAIGIVRAAATDIAANKTYNITRSDTKLCTLLEAAELAVKIVGKGSIAIADRDLSFPRRGRLDITRAVDDLGYKPTVDIEEGFRRYHHWYLENPILWSR